MKRIVPGIHSVAEVLRVRPKATEELWLREGDLTGELHDFLLIAKSKNIKVKRVSQQTLDREVQSHQGVLAFVTGAPEWPDRKNLQGLKDSLIIVLDGINDPHNFGSIMRSAWNLGATGVIIPKDRSVGFVPAAQKVGSGAFEHLPVLEVSNLHAELTTLKDLGYWIYGLEEGAEKSLYNIDFANKCIIVVGNEEEGLRKPTVSACDELLQIPQNPTASSFNAAVAAAIVGSEFMRQRALPQK